MPASDTELVKEWLQTRNDDLLDELKRRSQHVIDRQVFQRTGVAEHHRCGTARLGLHARLERFGNASEYDLCMWIERTRHFERVPNASDEVLHNDPSPRRICGGQIDGSVLISIREVSEEIEGVQRRGGQVYSRVWLERVDYFLRIVRNTVHYVVPLLGVFGGIGEDRELASSTVVRWVGGSGDGANEIVECGMGVVNKVTDQDTEPEARLRFDPVSDPSLAEFLVNFEGDNMLTRLQVRREFTARSVVMFVCARELGEDACER